MAGRPPAGTRRRRSIELGLPDADAGHVRELCTGAAGRTAAAGGGAACGDRGRRRDPATRTAADLPGRLRLPGVRAAGGPARTGSLHALRGRSPHRRLLPLHRVAVSALPLRPAVHARELRAGAPWAGGRAVGVQGDRGRLQPRCGRADRARGRASRSLPHLGVGVRRPEPRAARAGDRRRTQRHTAAAGAGGRACAERGDEPALAGSRGRTGRRRWHQGHRRPVAPVPGAGAGARAPARRTRRGRRAGGGRAGGRARLRRARARLSQCRRRAAATGGHAQHPRRDRAPVRAQRHAELVARSIRRRLPRSAGICTVAHRARRRLARGRRLGDDRAAGLDRLAVALVCGLGAAASGRQR